MKLVVGLGNPGKEYKNTRHNIGFMVLDNYLGKVKFKTKFEADYFILEKNNEQILFIKPITYMNLSGKSVKRFVDFYKIAVNDILVIQDDMDMPIGKIKVKKDSSSGGHNGIKSIINELNTQDYARLKIGIGKSEIIPTERYVVSKFRDEEFKIINDNMTTYTNLIDDYLNNGLEYTMQKYNNK